jgi:hypothetical protein
MKTTVLLALVFITMVAGGCTTADEPRLDSLAVTAQQLRPLLNSERIELKFGSYAIRVIKNDNAIRVSNLYSTSQGQETTRTLAVVVYPENMDALLFEEHQKVVSGQSLGAVFKSSGWKIEKKHRYFGELDTVGHYSKLHSLMGRSVGEQLAVHIYDFVVSKGEKELHYATISEVHHPDYLESMDLSEVYKTEYKNKLELNKSIELQLKRIEMELKSL